MARLEVQELSFCYPGAPRNTLDDISFDVPAGGSLALLGSSGAGKTTLLNILSGLLPCESGRILLDGVDVAALGAGDRRVAQVFQFPVMYDSLSVRENIAFPLRTQGVSRREQARRAEAVAALFDLTDILRLRPRSLSLFQKQLVGFAKALVRDDCPMVLLDEPLTAVEPAMKWRLRRTVKRAQAELNTTMVYVTHDQTEALTFADKVSVLHDGALLQTGTSQELYERPAHAEVARFIGNPGMNLLRVTQGRAGLEFAGQKTVQTAEQIEEQLTSTLISRAFSERPGLAKPDLGKNDWQIGFRPEWARLVSPGQATSGKLQLEVSLINTRLTGGDAEQALGLARVSVGCATAQIACELGEYLNRPLLLEIERCELFCNGQRFNTENSDHPESSESSESSETAKKNGL